jgi:hypothetical protein
MPWRVRRRITRSAPCARFRAPTGVLGTHKARRSDTAEIMSIAGTAIAAGHELGPPSGAPHDLVRAPPSHHRLPRAAWDDEGGWVTRTTDQIYGSGYVGTAIVGLDESMPRRHGDPTALRRHPPPRLCDQRADPARPGQDVSSEARGKADARQGSIWRPTGSPLYWLSGKAMPEALDRAQPRSPERLG